MYTIQTASNHIYSLSKLTDQESDFLTPLLLDALEQNVFYDKLATEKMLTIRIEIIYLQARGLVQKGQVIISQGELITDEKFLALTSYKQNYEGQNWKDGSGNWFFLGQLLLVFVALLFFPCFTTISFRCFSR